MKVLITKSSKPLAWYKYNIGDFFEVDETIYDNNFYQLKNDPHKLIDIDDCLTTKELRPEKIKRLLKLLK